MATKDEAMAHGYRLLQKPVLALKQASEILRMFPGDAAGHRLTAMAKRRLGDVEGAREAEQRALNIAKMDPELIQAASLLGKNDVDEADSLLRTRLRRDPLDPVALHMLAMVAIGVGETEDAVAMLGRAVSVMPSYTDARSNLAKTLLQVGRTKEAASQYDELERLGALGASRRVMRATAYSRLGEYEKALADQTKAIEEEPNNSSHWLQSGHLFKTVGDQEKSVAAFRKALSIKPAMGEAWWSLANLKLVKFDDADRQAMEKALEDDVATAEDQLQINFALGKYFEDQKDSATSWDRYAAGNRARLKLYPHSASNETRLVDRTIALMTPDFFAKREGVGCPDDAPIFVLGMPRAGSTLIEQILSSHSKVEGTMELGDIAQLARRVGNPYGRDKRDNYPANLVKLDDKDLRQMGEAFIERTRIHRKEGKPHFIDKMPNNWQHAGLIRLILPNAKIIDARRHPLDCGFGNFKQHFAKGQTFAYDLGDFGHYYRDYVRLMDHMDEVQPGAIHRVIHEQLLDDPEAEVRRMLAYCGLDFEEGCLKFYENKRAVRTASAEQVRQPLTKKAVGRWKLYEQWLGPLKEALGPALDSWDKPQPGAA